MARPAKNILWLSISRVLSLVMLFFAYTQLLRYLGAFNYGQYQFVLSYAALFGVVIDFGIQQYIIKKMSEDRFQVKKYFYNFLAVEIILSLLVYASMLSIALIAGYERIVIKALIFIGLGVALHGLTYPFLAVVTTYYDLKKAALLNFISSVINVSMIFLTIWLSQSIVFLATQQIIFASIAIVMYYFFARVHMGNISVKEFLSSINYLLIKKILIASIPFAVLVGFSTVYNRIDMILISKILGFTATGLYGAAYKIFDLIAFFPAVVSHSLYPLFAALMSEGKRDQVKSTLQLYFKFMVAVALPIAVGGSILADKILPLIAGQNFASPQDFAEASRALAVLVWAPALLCIYIVFNSLVISQLTKKATYITGANVIINITGNLILLPKIGIISAAVMTVISELLQGIFYYYFVSKNIAQISLLANIWKQAVSAAVMGVAVYVLKDYNFFALVIIGAGVYALMLAVTGFASIKDLKNFSSSFIKKQEA